MIDKLVFIVIILLTLCFPALAACQPVSSDPPDPTVRESASSIASIQVTGNIELSPTATFKPTDLPTAPATRTPLASATHVLEERQATVVPTQQLTITLSATLTPTKQFVPPETQTAIAVSDPVDRSCPDPPPAKPDYDHYFLSPNYWPRPEDDVETHFWFGKPLPGGGRLLYTEWLPYGYDAGGRYLIHNGIDAAEPQGTPLLAVDDGTVIVAGDDYSKLYGWRCDWYGNLVVIEVDRQWRGQPVYIVYGHVLEIAVEVGQRVERGQKVAEVGVGGAAKLPHLHFEVRVASNEFASTRNPLLWLEPPSTRGIIVGRLVDPDGRPWQGVVVNLMPISENAESKITWTYLDDPQHLIGSDEVFAENFVFGDAKPGKYDLVVSLQGETYRKSLEVVAGEAIAVEIVTVPLKNETPTPGAADNENNPTPVQTQSSP